MRSCLAVGEEREVMEFLHELDPEVLVHGKGIYILEMRLLSPNIRPFAFRMQFTVLLQTPGEKLSGTLAPNSR